MTRAATGALVAALATLGPRGDAGAQEGPVTDVNAEVFAGGELENYLRNLQTLGKASPYPWSIRGFSPAEIDQLAPVDAVHPWAERYRFAGDGSGRFTWTVIRPQADLVYNSAFPYGYNDGPVWSGRGATMATQFGVAARWGPATLVLTPRAFYADNADFALAPTGRTGDGRFVDPRAPGRIDLPQRFGDGGYGRIDPGESTLRVDLPWLTAGVSTAAQFWGPAAVHPILLGNNAGGYPHAFVGTPRPVGIRTVQLHARLEWGVLSPSDFAPISPDRARRRFMSGIVALAYFPTVGLELGGARFFHTAWPTDGLTSSLFLAPIESFLKVNLDTGQPLNNDDSNQLGSVFFRWVIPDVGFEVYGEYGREDHNWDTRDFLLEPDHISGYLLGLRRVWQRSADEYLVLRAELLNTRVSHLKRVRSQSRFYVHARVAEGHTHRGQALGSVAALGGGGSEVMLDLYHPDGRWSVGITRLVRDEEAPLNGGAASASMADVMYSLDAEALYFLGKLDLTATISGVYDLDRDFSGDRFNLRASAGVTWSF